MGGFLLAIAHHKGAAAAPSSGSHMFGMGLLIGLLIGLLAWDWLAWLGVIVAVVMLGALHLVSKTHIHGVHGVPAVHVSMGGLFWLLVLVIGAIGGGSFRAEQGRRALGSAPRPPP